MLSLTLGRRGTLAALALLVTLPGVAQASTLSLSPEGDAYVLTGADSETNKVQVYQYDGDPRIVFRDDLPAGGQLTLDGSLGGRCRRVETFSRPEITAICDPTGITKLRFALGDQPAGTYEDATVRTDVHYPSDMDGGPGSDTLVGNRGAGDNLKGGPGADVLNSDYDSSELGPGVDTLDGGDGDDALTGGSRDDLLRGGSGKDHLSGGVGNDELHGGDDIDRLVGENGNDRLYGEGGSENLANNGFLWGGNGSDLVDGGDGDDEMHGENPDHPSFTPGDSDTFAGGAGVDRVNYLRRSSRLRLTLDGQANDGAMSDGGTAAENDNIGSDIEQLWGGNQDDIISGANGNEELVGGTGTDVLSGGGGDDRLSGQAGADQLDGGDGDDQLSGGEGNDKLLGSGGNDQLEGNGNDDDLDGGAGRDSFGGDTFNVRSTDVGNDTIRADDGVGEAISCGAGSDTAFLDALDVLPVDSWNACENVTRSGAGGGGGAGGAGGGAGGLALAKPRLTSLAKIVQAGALMVPVTLPGAGKVTVRAYVDAATARKVRISAKKLVSIAKGSKTLAAAGKANVKVKLTAKAKKRLKRYRKAIKVTLRATYTPASGKTVTKTQRVTLKK